MPPTEAQRQANKRYQAAHIASLACRVKVEQAEKFKAYCRKKGRTVNAELTEYVKSCIDDE